MMGFGSVFLSAWGWEEVTAVFLVFYFIIILGVIYSPITWGGISGTAIVAGQPGGEKGFNLNDGVNVLKRWAPIAQDKMGLVLIFWIPVWLLYTILFSTEGHVKENLLLFVLIPTLVYFAKDEWPTGKLVFRIAGFVLVAIAVYVVGATVLKTVNQATVTPATREVQAYEEQLAQNQQTFEAELARELREKVEGGQTLSAQEQQAWDTLRQRAHAQSNAGRVQALVTEVADAKPTDARWWKAHWYLPAGAVVAIVFALWWFGRTASGTAVATTAGAGAHASAGTSPRTKWFWRVVILGVVGYLGWSIYTEQGWPGEYLANRAYVHHARVELVNMSDQRICRPALKPGDWYASFPDELYREKYRRKEAGFYAVWPGGQNRLSFTEIVWINGVHSSVDEKIHVEPGGCFMITPMIAQAIKETAVIYGNPQCATPDSSCVRSTTPTPAYLNIAFRGKQ
ncbi:MAG: hypothetical protein KBD27_01380 [Candidatus Moranbacteria bacterium]|nr:hypothetical protein [Candidatus Moranbacteria bacterium]